MNLVTRALLRSVTTFALLAVSASLTFAQLSDETPTYPNDLSAAGLQAAMSNDPLNSDLYLQFLPADILDGARNYVAQLRSQGLLSGSGRFSINLAPVNIRANDPTGDAIGETQSEVSVAVDGDTVVVGWNDSRGFTAGFTLSSFAYSTDGGITFVDGGNVPLALPTDQAFGDTGLDTDENGNWYLNSIYTRAAGAPGPTAQQNIGVHHGRFNGLGQLVWDIPVMAAIGTAATGNLDKCLLGADRVTGNVYTAYTRFTATPQIEIVRSTTNGLTWGAPIVLDNTAVPTASKQAARPLCGPGGEVYVVWEKGANTINCPAAGSVANTTGQMAFARSLNFGVSYDPFIVIGTVNHSWTWSGPGDLRERANEFPDIAVDRSGGPYNGRIYVTWHESAPWTAAYAAGPVTAELNNVANANPGTPELFSVGDDCTGSTSVNGDLDYWQFNAVQGQTYLMNLDPQGFNCGVSGTTRGMRMRLFAVTNPFPNPTGFPDSLLAASALGTFAQRIVWTCPSSGPYLIRLQNSTTAIGTYTLRVRTALFGAPSPARDTRDVVLVTSSNQGLSFGPEALISDGPAGLEDRRPFINADGLGHVHAFWHDSRDAGFGSSASLTSIYGVTTRDGGATWTPNYQVTDELSFFSFNTRAVPNLGDYNMSASNSNVTIAAWSDQRISTGDVRTPGTNTYTAGLGPEAYTARVIFNHTTVCPADLVVEGGNSTTLQFRINNTGTIPDTYDYSVTDANGWIFGGSVVGTTPVVQPSSFFDVFVQIDLPLDCQPSPADPVTIVATPVGDPDGQVSCATIVNCDIPVPTLVSIFTAQDVANGLELSWHSDATAAIRGWNVYRSRQSDSGFERLNASLIPMMSGGRFSYVDASPLSGAAWYELRGIFSDGTERRVETIQFSSSGVSREFSLRMAGSNPFHGRTSFVYTLPKRSRVELAVFNVLGQRVRSIASGVMDAGTYTESLSLKDGGAKLGAGLYLVKLKTDFGSRTVRVMAID